MNILYFSLVYTEYAWFKIKLMSPQLFTLISCIWFRSLLITATFQGRRHYIIKNIVNKPPNIHFNYSWFWSPILYNNDNWLIAGLTLMKWIYLQSPSYYIIVGFRVGDYFIFSIPPYKFLYLKWVIPWQIATY